MPRRKGNWVSDLASGLRMFVIFGFASMIIIPILVVAIIVLVVKG